MEQEYYVGTKWMGHILRWAYENNKKICKGGGRFAQDLDRAPLRKFIPSSWIESQSSSINGMAPGYGLSGIMSHPAEYMMNVI